MRNRDMILPYTVKQITGDNLTLAWVNALVECSNASHKKISPAAVTFPVYDNENDNEIPEIRNILDDILFDNKKTYSGNKVSETVANTIFPESIWRIAKGDRQLFYSKYYNMFPLVKKSKNNSNGTYFSRLIAYDINDKKVNQLEHIISTWAKKNHRLSALQAGVFNPAKDHTDQRIKGFPCLQQIVFQPIGVNGTGGLSLIAFYAKQAVIEKAYGNYLDLLRLGKFMAENMGLELKSVTCIASDLSLYNTSKNEYSNLIKSVEKVISNAGN